MTASKVKVENLMNFEFTGSFIIEYKAPHHCCDCEHCNYEEAVESGEIDCEYEIDGHTFCDDIPSIFPQTADMDPDDSFEVEFKLMPRGSRRKLPPGNRGTRKIDVELCCTESLYSNLSAVEILDSYGYKEARITSSEIRDILGHAINKFCLSLGGERATNYKIEREHRKTYYVPAELIIIEENT